MSIQTAEAAREYLSRVFKCLFDADKPATALSEFFAPDYKQEANGVHLNYEEFLDHAQTLKSTITEASVEFEDIVFQQDLIADIHSVTAKKKDGATVRFQVIAFYKFREGKITSVRELTHMQQGDAEYTDLGHRTST